MTTTQRTHVTPTISAPELREVDPRTLLVGRVLRTAGEGGVFAGGSAVTAA